MNNNVDDRTTVDDEKEENAVIRILQSSTCRRLFSWGGSGSAIPCELTEEAREEQRLRWNFDFQTETPLPGRYQWVRTGEANGHRRNGSDDLEKKRPCEGGSKRKKPPTESQYTLPEKRRLEEREATGSCDKSLNDPQDSDERSLDLDDSSYEVNLT